MDLISGIAVLIFLGLILLLVKTYVFKSKPKPMVSLDQRIERLMPLLKRNEALCRSNPNLYLLQIFAIALLGYAYIWLVLVLAIAATIFGFILVMKFPVLALKFGLVVILGLGALIWTVAKSMWVKFEPPEGIRLTKESYPKLFDLIEEVRAKINGPVIHEVVLDQQMNAAVYQIPRLGYMGWNKNYLLLGLPLMHAVSNDQFRSIIGHEMGHLAEKHGGPYAWVYSTHQVWNNLMTNFEKSAEQGYASFFMSFFDWYGPLFAAFTFPARREKEYGADQCAIDMVGKDLTAQALICVGVKISYISTKYWSDITDRAKTLEEPPRTAFAAMPQAFINEITSKDAEDWLTQSLKEKTNFGDTHPCKTDRLARILNIPKPEVAAYAHKVLKESFVVEETAAQVYIGEHLNSVTMKFDSDWYNNIDEVWRSSHAQYQEWRKELEELEAKRSEGELKAEELYRLALRTTTFYDNKTAFPLFEKALELSPDDPNIHDSFARCLFDENDPRCVEHFERAMKLDRMMEYECAQILQIYFSKNDDEQSADKYKKIYNDFTVEYMEMQRERVDFLPSDSLKPHGLNAEQIENLVAQLGAYPKLKCLYMFQKVVRFFPDTPCYVMVIDSLVQPKQTDIEVQTELVNAMAHQLILPGFTLIRSRIGIPGNLKSALKRIPDAKIFPQ